MKKALRLKSPGSGSKKSLGSGGSGSGPGKPKRVMKVGELMRIQMGISDAMDSRVRRALLRISTAQAFIQNLALFLTSFYKSHIRVLETTKQNIAALLMGPEYLINISYMDDTEVFKIMREIIFVTP